ncbi:MAG TPA: hypothetical protein DDX29_12095 [Clostridiales bacterium]|nr:hypothetical protein [Clostridiales bacterium]
MKLSAFHKSQGDEVHLNDTLKQYDYVYASVLFDHNKNNGRFATANECGGPQYPDVNLPPHIERIKPDYDLYKKNDFSIGYTFRPCYRRCEFCLTKTFKQPDKRHHSIWEFHDKRFKKICLMNNNTFMDPFWKDTFEEIWKENLILKEHGLDIRLLDAEKAEAIKKTKFDGRYHFAWDRMKDEQLILRGLQFAKEYDIKARFYVLAGYNTTWKEDLYRCQILINYDHVPYIMPYTDNPTVKAMKNFINSPGNWWNYKDDITKGWDDFIKGQTKSKKKEKAKSDADEQQAGLF